MQLIDIWWLKFYHELRPVQRVHRETTPWPDKNILEASHWLVKIRAHHAEGSSSTVQFSGTAVVPPLGQ